MPWMSQRPRSVRRTAAVHCGTSDWVDFKGFTARKLGYGMVTVAPRASQRGRKMTHLTHDVILGTVKLHEQRAWSARHPGRTPSRGAVLRSVLYHAPT